jgi:hypothetical protein
MCRHIVWYNFLDIFLKNVLIPFLSVEEYANQPESRVFPACCLIGLLLDPEDGGSMFLRNIGKPYRTRASYPRITVLPVTLSCRLAIHL